MAATVASESYRLPPKPSVLDRSPIPPQRPDRKFPNDAKSIYPPSGMYLAPVFFSCFLRVDWVSQDGFCALGYNTWSAGVNPPGHAETLRTNRATNSGHGRRVSSRVSYD